MKTKPIQTIPLTMSSSYVSDWGFWEAARELVQNALDHRDATKNPIAVGYLRPTKTFLITSTGCKLDLSSLVLGATAKSDDSTIRGKFGEGYKLALLVLLRLGLDVKIYNQDEVWVPSFEHNELFNLSLLTIKVYPNPSTSKNVIFAIKGMTRSMALKIKNRLIIDREKSIGFKTSYGTILTEERFVGKVFVGGLYVSTPELDLKHGFDFDPEHVQLGRDRGLIDSFNIQWLASQMWLSVKETDTTAIEESVKSIYSGSSGTGYVGSFSNRNDSLRERVAEKFYEDTSATAIPVSTEAEAKATLTDYDNAIPVIVKESVKDFISQSDVCKAAKSKLIPRIYLTPNEIVNEILSRYKFDLGPMYKTLVEELVPLSIRWIAIKEAPKEDE